MGEFLVRACGVGNLGRFEGFRVLVGFLFFRFGLVFFLRERGVMRIFLMIRLRG